MALALLVQVCIGSQAQAKGPKRGPKLGSFDSVAYVRDAYARRVEHGDLDQLVVPFEIDDEVRRAIEGRINLGASERVRTDQVVEFVFGYLGLDYQLTPTHDALGTFHARSGNCLSFVNLFVGIARERRLNPFYVEVKDYHRWSFREGMVVSHGHIVAGMRIDGELSTFDFLPYRAKSYRDFAPIDDLKAAAHFYNNLAAEALLDGEVEGARGLATIATEIEPTFDKAINNLAVAELRLGRPKVAAELLAGALESSPESVHLLTNMVRTQQQLGNTARANALLERIEALELANPFFYVYRGELALAAGDMATALGYMRRALRQDGELPEVHIGLLKTYLALGDTERALHHLERALRLDATHQEARRYAAMLLGPQAGGG